MKKTISVVICLSLALLSAGISPWQAVASEVVRAKVSGRIGVPTVSPVSVSGVRNGTFGLQTVTGLHTVLTNRLPALPAPRAQAALSLPAAIAPSAALAPAQPAPLPAAGKTDFARTLSRLSAPSLLSVLPSQAGGESVQAASSRDFARRIGQAAAIGSESVSVPGASAAISLSGRLAPAQRSAERSAAEPAAPLVKQARSPVFPLLGALGATLAWAGTRIVPELSATLSRVAMTSDGLYQTVVSGMGYAALAVAGAFAVEAVSDLGAYAYGMWRGRQVKDSDFLDFVRREVAAGRIDAGVAEMLRVHRPDRGDWSLDFAFTAGREIYMRPELAASPWLFRRVLSHELGHLRDNAQRGPPAGRLAGLWGYIRSEFRARAGEFKSDKIVRNTHIPLLERALKSAQLSLALPRPYDVLVMNAGSPELKDPAIYKFLSQGNAHVHVFDGAVPQEVLGRSLNQRRFKAIVLDQAFTMLPADRSLDAKRLDQALQQLEDIFVMATRLAPQSGAFADDPGAGRRYAQLAAMAPTVAASSDRKEKERFEKLVRELWRDVSAAKLKGMQVTDIMGSLYRAMPDRGLAFLPFGPSDPGLPVWEKLLRFWEAADGGQFRLTRVDLENGGHILILRKLEARVGLWLRPAKGFLAVSIPDVGAAGDSREAARTALAAAGFAAQLDKFDELEVEIRHVFGADVGRQEIYVTVPRRNAGAIRRYVTGSDMGVESSQSDFEPHLLESADLLQVKPVWQAGVTGADGIIMWIDTGADRTHEDFGGRLDVVDMVHEGGEDWVGHGTHVAGISISGDGLFTGMAKAARGIMAKVFSRESPGASDGDIMGSAAISIQKGVDVINLSLGSRGSSSDNLASFFSQLTHQKNSNGEYPFVAASAGNAGPFDRTLSQPAAGVDVFATAAASVGEEDGAVEISFFSSVGPDVDKRYAVKRVRLKPDAAAKGGNVTTEAGSNNVYRLGVYSAKSKDMAKSPSDTQDGKHTGMSGTSMSSPMLAGIAMLLKLAIRMCGAEDEFAKEHMPLVLKALIMRTADDMQVPVWFQGAGFVNAWAAVKLTADLAGYVFKNAVMRLLEHAAPGGGRPAPVREPWDWVRSYKQVGDLEDQVYSAAEVVKSEARARFDDGSGEGGEESSDARRVMNESIQAEVMAEFQKKRVEVLPRLLAALRDPVWLVRRQAAMVLFNLKAPEASLPLAEAALNDADGRVRQLAMLALAEMPDHSTDMLLRKAAADPRWGVAIYAAYALARHGDRNSVPRIVAELSNKDKRVRFSATWLLGQLGGRATAVETEALSYLVKNTAERGNIRHLAAAALSNLAAEQPAAVSDTVVKDLLEAAGPQNLALTRTAGKVFPSALRSKELVARMRAEPLRAVVADFVNKNKASVSRPGALGELVSLLARVINLPLEMPTPVIDPAGTGVAGVDQAVGPLDVIIGLPAGLRLSAYRDAAGDASAALAEAGLGAGILSRFETGFKAALPLSRALWLSVPAHKLFALSLELRNRGYSVRVSQPEYNLTRRVGTSPWEGSTLDLSREYSGLPEGADLSLVRIIADRATSEAKVMAALEALRARIGDPLRTPAVIVVSLGSQSAAGSDLSRLINAMLLEDFGVVLPAGNEGPAQNSVSGLAQGSLAVVVAAAGKTAGLESYSARGSADSPAISWADEVEDLEPSIPTLTDVAAAAARAVLEPENQGEVAVGTGAAAERTAGKLAGLARNMRDILAGQKLALPKGYFFYLADIVKRTLSPMPERGAHEAGAGLFQAPGGALELLRTRLLDPEPVLREANQQAKLAEQRQQSAVPPSSPAKAARKAVFAAAHA
ncbi:MAG: S8 family serine peptidase, partial [Elusimicrobiota bacterium]